MSQYNNNSNNPSPIASIATVAFIIAAVVVLIIFLKCSTLRSLDADGYLRTQQDSIVATPQLPNEGKGDFSEGPALPDTIMGTDERDAADAGFEDGYWAGYDDAHLGEENASYDESSAFPTADRKRYASNYREGYAEGWAAGIADREQADKQEEKHKLPEHSDRR